MSAEALRNPTLLGGKISFQPGRRAAPLQVRVVRELTVEDLLKAESTSVTPAKTEGVKIKQRHHHLARTLAQGRTYIEASAITGYEPGYISILATTDPAFQELLKYYEDMEKKQYSVARADVHEMMASLGVESMMELHRRLAEEPEKFSIGDLRKIAEAMQDRTGYGKSSTVKHAHEHSISSETIAAIKRNTSAPATVAEDDRRALLRLATRRTAEHLPETETSDWIEGEGHLLREEGDPNAGEALSDGAGPVSQVDQVPGSAGDGSCGT